MRMLIYAGPAAARDQVLEYSAGLARASATAITLVTGGGQERYPLVDEAARRIAAPEGVAVTLQALPGDPHQAILAATEEQQYDLVIFGRLHRPLGRLIPGPRSKAIAQRLHPSVLRVQGVVRPPQRILVASGGDYHTFEDVSTAARLAGPLGASVTIVHVVSQQSLVFEGFGERHISIGEFLAGSSPEASTLRRAAALLRERGITTTVRGRSGPVLDELLDELRSREHDLLVVGAHRIASPLDRILLEDITGELLDMSPIPVLVVKGHQP